MFLEIMKYNILLLFGPYFGVILFYSYIFNFTIHLKIFSTKFWFARYKIFYARYNIKYQNFLIKISENVNLYLIKIHIWRQNVPLFVDDLNHSPSTHGVDVFTQIEHSQNTQYIFLTLKLLHKYLPVQFVYHTSDYNSIN